MTDPDDFEPAEFLACDDLVGDYDPLEQDDTIVKREEVEVKDEVL